MVLWNARKFGDIEQGVRNDEIRKMGHLQGQGNAI